MSRHVHVTVMEIPSPMIARYDYADAPRELLPWADPYIAQLVQKLARDAPAEAASLERSRGSLACDSPAPSHLLAEADFAWPEITEDWDDEQDPFEENQD